MERGSNRCCFKLSILELTLSQYHIRGCPEQSYGNVIRRLSPVVSIKHFMCFPFTDMTKKCYKKAQGKILKNDPEPFSEVTCEPSFKNEIESPDYLEVFDTF